MDKRPPMPPSDGRHEKKQERTLAEISVTNWLTPENASFFMKNGFLYIKHDAKEQRAFLCRQFPFELLWEFISVLDDSQQEIGIIRRLDDFTDEARDMIANELKRRYYAPVIKSILQVKERYGFSYWKVKTEEGDVSFTLHDTFRSIIRSGDRRLILLDVDGNRFEIPDAEALDRKSYKKIELYL
ncbi:MAG: DUF1854 domain-containing protein [Ruminococcaceae bacterium]|nr:DUF1854 domain-containing protein [Oscillospiraceae bacterium]